MTEHTHTDIEKLKGFKQLSWIKRTLIISLFFLSFCSLVIPLALFLSYDSSFTSYVDVKLISSLWSDLTNLDTTNAINELKYEIYLDKLNWNDAKNALDDLISQMNFLFPNGFNAYYYNQFMESTNHIAKSNELITKIDELNELLKPIWNHKGECEWFRNYRLLIQKLSNNKIFDYPMSIDLICNLVICLIPSTLLFITTAYYKNDIEAKQNITQQELDLLKQNANKSAFCKWLYKFNEHKVWIVNFIWAISFVVLCIAASLCVIYNYQDLTIGNLYMNVFSMINIISMALYLILWCIYHILIKKYQFSDHVLPKTIGDDSGQDGIYLVGDEMQIIGQLDTNTNE